VTVETRPLDNLQSLPYFAPELVLVVAILLLIVWDLVSSPRAKTAGLLAISLAACAYSAGTSAWLLVREAPAQNLFYGLLAFDRFSNMFRIVFACVTATIAVFSVPPIPEGHTIPGRGVRDEVGGRDDLGDVAQVRREPFAHADLVNTVMLFDRSREVRGESPLLREVGADAIVRC